MQIFRPYCIKKSHKNLDALKYVKENILSSPELFILTLVTHEEYYKYIAFEVQKTTIAIVHTMSSLDHEIIFNKLRIS